MIPPAPAGPPAYAELVAATNFSFLRGASSAAEMVLASLMTGHAGLGIADRNSVAGVVRAWSALRDLREAALPPAKEEDPALRAGLRDRAQGFRLLTGARLAFADGTPDVVAYPADRAGWGRLCRLLTRGNLRAAKGNCHLGLADLVEQAAGLLLIVLPGRTAPSTGLLDRIAAAAPAGLWIGATMLRRGDDRRRLAALSCCAEKAGVPLLACNDVLHADPAQRDLLDVLACIREGVTLDEAGRRLPPNAERHLKPATEMARLFADCPGALAETLRLIEHARFDLGELRYEYPDEPVPEGRDAQGWLTELTWVHAAQRWPDGVPARVRGLIRDELALIGRLDYARYFLTVHDIVREACARGILCQGRGSAANSAVCYALGITAVNPDDHDLLFARFISEERREPPDIDVDFEHERREEIIQYLYGKYGRHRAGLAGTVISYRPKSAIREVGKVFGLSEDVTAALSGTQWGSWGSDITRAQVVQAGLDPDNPVICRVVAFARRLLGFPRHLSQHVGGFVLTRGRLDEMVPIGNAAMAERTFIEWDKDDIDALGLMKVDVLALGMLSCIRRGLDLLRGHHGRTMGLADVPPDDRPTYAMLARGDSIGVFQVESRAQIAMAPRMRPATLYDLVIQVALVRPGPIQGNMVHPYLRRRAGAEPVSFPSPAPPHDPDELRHVLGRTLGVPLFQEQAMRLAMVAAEFTDVEANQLRRAMATFRHMGTIGRFEDMMVERMVARGYDRGFAQDCFNQIRGFGNYGFPESHAASFAKLVYISAWIKCHYPGIFACALLNAQPMGFYAPAQIVRDAREHGVEVRGPDVNRSHWDSTMEEAAHGHLALRLGLRQIEGLAEAEMTRMLAARETGPFASPEDMLRRAGLRRATLAALADADALGSLALSRREALWAVRRLPEDGALPLFAAQAAAEMADEPDARLPRMPPGEEVATDYQTLRLSLKAHPMAILRPRFAEGGILTCAQIAACRNGRFASTAGLVLVRQRPGKGNAVFITLEDETGICNVILWARDLERFRKAVMGARLMQVAGRVQQSPEGVAHLIATRITDRSADLSGLWDDPPAWPSGAASLPRQAHPRAVRSLPKSRDFH